MKYQLKEVIKIVLVPYQKKNLVLQSSVILVKGSFLIDNILLGCILILRIIRMF
jgi:hypothetical protein